MNGRGRGHADLVPVRPRREGVVIVGGGTAGCVLAARLSEDAGRSVCLVEAGPDYGPHDGGGWPSELPVHLR